MILTEQKLNLSEGNCDMWLIKGVNNNSNYIINDKGVQATHRLQYCSLSSPIMCYWDPDPRGGMATVTQIVCICYVRCC